MDYGGRRHLGKQPAGEILPAHREGPQAAGGRDQQVGQAGGSDRADCAAVGAGGQIMKRRQRMLEQLEQEIREHIEMETQDNIARGMSPEEARYAAMRKFGNVTRVQEDAREVWSFVWLEQLWQDVRFGLRMLLKSPAFTAVAVLTLAFGIGANTAIFSLIDAVMLRSLPVENPAQLMLLKWGARKAPNVHGMMSSGDCPVDMTQRVAENPTGC